jgi:hypothetical protein
VQGPQTGPPTPTTQRCTAITCDEFGLLPVRSPLLGESRLFSSPPGTEMVQFPGCSFRNLWIQSRMMAIQTIGLPHSAIRGSRDVCSSPRLIAAYHGLLRTAAPRHPPWTLSRLTILSLRSSVAVAREARAPRAPAGRPQNVCRTPRTADPEQLPLRAPQHASSAPTGISPRAPLAASRASGSRHAPLHPSLALSKNLRGPPCNRHGHPIDPARHPVRGRSDRWAWLELN